MIYIVSLHKYSMAKKKIESERAIIEASSIDTLFNQLYEVHQFEHYDLHFLKKPNNKDNLYRIKITARYKNEMDFLRSQQHESSNEASSNVCTLERSKFAAVGNVTT
jgi:hypothetical protein